MLKPELWLGNKSLVHPAVPSTHRPIARSARELFESFHQELDTLVLCVRLLLGIVVTLLLLYWIGA